MYEGYSRHLLIYLFLISKLDNWIHWIHFIHKISFHLYQNLADMLVLLSSPSTLIQSISTELLWMLNMSPRMDPLGSTLFSMETNNHSNLHLCCRVTSAHIFTQNTSSFSIFCFDIFLFICYHHVCHGEKNKRRKKYTKTLLFR